MHRVTGFVLAIIFFNSCTSDETGNVKDVSPESIWFEYRVWGDEETGEMTIKLQYRFGGPNGTTLLLEEPSKAELDGVVLTSETSKMSGVYYEVSKPVKEFQGRHSIVFTDINKKQYKEEFTFTPISLKTNIPGVIERSDLVLEVNGLEAKDYIRIMMTDTASFSEGITRIDTVRDGKIIITREDLESLASGPIHFELAKEDESRIKDGTKRGGRFSISYELKREFELKDATNP